MQSETGAAGHRWSEGPKPLKVAIVGPELYPIPPIRGGAVELYIDEISRHIGPMVDRLDVISPYDPDLLHTEKIEGGATIHRLQFPRHAGFRSLWKKNRPLSYSLKAARLLSDLKPDVVHVHNRPTFVNTFRRMLDPRTKIILHMHNVMDYLGRQERPSTGFVPDCDAFLACSDFLLKHELPRYGLDERTGYVAYNGVNSRKFVTASEASDRRRKLRYQYGIAEGELVVLFAGKLRESKGIDCLVNAMRLVFDSVPNAVLVVVGGTRFGRGEADNATDFSSEIRASMERLPGKAVMTGFVPPQEMPEMYLMGDIFVGPSTCLEAFGMVHIEAQASGLPVVATTRGGLPEVVQDGVTGFLVEDPHDQQKLADPIIRLLQDAELRRALGGNARLRAETGFNWDSLARETVDLYHMLQEQS